jgi:hypothetical protein
MKAFILEYHAMLYLPALVLGSLVAALAVLQLMPRLTSPRMRFDKAKVLTNAGY